MDVDKSDREPRTVNLCFLCGRAAPGDLMTLNAGARRILPGFGPALGFTMLYLCLIVLIPLSTIVISSSSLSWSHFWHTVSAPRALASYRLSLGAALGGALVNAVFGLLVAWVLVRYEFPGKRFVDSLVDLPFALPTAVAGITLTAIYSENGWLGGLLAKAGIKVAYTPVGVVVALIFIGLPFVVRTVEPVLRDLDSEGEEAAASLGAGKFQTFFHVILPQIFPSLMTGFVLALARGLGEYGSIIFISGNMPMRTEITPLLIMIKLEQFHYADASAIALVFLLGSFILLLPMKLLRGNRAGLGRPIEE
jgi:sulfate transport system permease protein